MHTMVGEYRAVDCFGFLIDQLFKIEEFLEEKGSDQRKSVIFLCDLATDFLRNYG